MALPITILSSGIGFRPPQGGPFKSGTSFYLFSRTVASSDHQIFKADGDDPSSGWTAQDTTNSPSNDPSTSLSVHSWLDGTTIHIGTQYNTDEVEYHEFDCSTNTWSIANESVSTTSDTTADACSISVRSDGDVIAAYGGEQHDNMGSGYDRVDLARRETGSWTADISISGLGKTETHMRLPFVVRADATNDRMHIFYHDTTGNGLHYSTYLSGNTWGHQHTEPDTSTAAATALNSVRAVAYDDGGTTKVRAYYVDATSLDVSVVGFDDADSPGASISITTDISDNAPASFASAVDDPNDTQHLLYVNSTTIYHDETGDSDDTWGTDASELGSLTTPVIYSCNVYDNGGTVLAYLYKDGSNYRYNERTLAAAATSLVYKPNPFQHMLMR